MWRLSASPAYSLSSGILSECDVWPSISSSPTRSSVYTHQENEEEEEDGDHQHSIRHDHVWCKWVDGFQARGLHAPYRSSTTEQNASLKGLRSPLDLRLWTKSSSSIVPLCDRALPLAPAGTPPRGAPRLNRPPTLPEAPSGCPAVQSDTDSVMTTKTASEQLQQADHVHPAQHGQITPQCDDSISRDTQASCRTCGR